MATVLAHVPLVGPRAQVAPRPHQSVIVDLSVLDQWPQSSKHLPAAATEPGDQTFARASNRAAAPVPRALGEVRPQPEAPPPFPAYPQIDHDRIAPAAGAEPAASSNPAAAAESGSTSPLLFNERYYWNFVRAPAELISSPVDWSAADWGRAALVVTGFVGLMFADKPIRDFVQDHLRNGTTDDAASIFETGVGEFGIVVPAAAGAVAFAAAFGDRRDEAAALEAFQSLLLTTVFTDGIKYLAHRHRPNESPDDAFRFDGPGLGGSRRSLPSGHASNAFALATALALNYPNDDFVGPIAYALAGLVAWSRVNDDKHWMTDVVLGGGLGYAMSYTVHRLNDFGMSRSGVAAGPYLNREAQGVQVTVRF